MSWADGMAFCALIHAHRPELIPFDSLSPKNKEKNMELAFSTATKLGIPPLLDVEDMFLCAKPEQFSIMTYLSQFYHFFKTGNAKASGLGTIKIESTVPAKRPAASSIAPSRGGSSVTSPPAKRPKVEESHPCCVKCSKPLCGNTVEAPGGMYHEACFGCTKCGKKLQRCLNVENKPYCDSCGRIALAESKRSSSRASPQPSKLSAAAAIVGAAANKSKWQQQRDDKEKAEKEQKERFLREKEEKEKIALEKRKQQEKEREEARLAKEKEDKDRRDQQERERKSQAEKEKREREERERNARDEQQRRDREKNEREDREKREREDRERREREQREQRERDARERREREQRDKEQKKQKDLSLREKEKIAREERERKEKERKEKEKIAREEREQQERERQERKRNAEAQRNAEKSAREERERKLEQERQDAQRIEEERKAKFANSSAPVASSSNSTNSPASNSSSDGGQSEWMQKVSQMNKKREEKRQTYVSPSVAASPPVVDRKTKKNEERKQEQTPDNFEKGMAPVQRKLREEKAKKPQVLASDDVEISEDEIMQAEAEVVVFNFEERVQQLEGFLFQKLKKRKWIKRWFMVKDGRLTSYSSKPEENTKSGSRIELSRSLSQDVFIIPLDTIEEIRPSKDEPCGFQIKTNNSKSQETICLRCGNPDDVGVWISGLYHHLNAVLRDPLKHEASETRQAPVIQDGILQQRKKNSKWKKYWFCLRNGFISCYLPRHRNNSSKRPQYKLALFDCQIEEYEPEKYNFSAFQITTQTDESIILLADNAEDMLFWINAILKEKFLIEETINSITIS